MTATASTVSGPVPVERRSDRASAPEGNGAAAPHDAAAPPLPLARAEGVELLGSVAGSGYRRAPALVRRADGQTVQLTPVLFALLEAIDGARDEAALAAVLSERSGRHVAAEDVRYLVEAKLRPLGLLRRRDGAQPQVEKANPLLGLRLKLLVSDPGTTRRLTAPFTPLFHTPVVLAVVAAFALTSWWVLFEEGLASAAHHAIYEPTLLLLVFGLTLLSAAFHEIGHAAACRYAGATPGGMGVGLYLVWPAFYTDVSDSYRMSRRDRLRVDLGGLYFNAVFGVAIAAVWAVVRWDALLLVIAAQLIQMARQLVPIVRFDGYHVLADLVGVPDLFAHIKPTLLGLLPTRSRRGGNLLKPWARAVVTIWVALVVPLIAALLALLVVVLPRIVATAWDSLGLHWADVRAGWSGGEISAFAVGAISMLLICLPLIGIPYLLARVVRRTGAGVWRVTDGRPRLRLGAAALAAALLAAVAWAWWPDGQYRPIEAGETWKLPEPRSLVGGPEASEVPVVRAIPVTSMERPASEPATRAASAPAEAPPKARWAVVLVPRGTAEEGEISFATGIVPPTDLPGPGTGEDLEPPVAPTEPERAPAPPPANDPVPTPVPEPAPEASPASEPQESSRSEWPFPFDPPAAPEEGDNRASAVNTRDGSTEVDVALALVWHTDGDPVENRNEAWALASCKDCKTVAIAFQVVFVIGHAQVVTPVNAAAALNYVCEHCITHALAVQLVATLTREPSKATLAELERVWQELETSSESFELLPVEQVYADLLETRTEILAIVAQEGVREIEGEMEPTAAGDEADVADGGDAPADASVPEEQATTDTGPEAPASGSHEDGGGMDTADEPAPASTTPTETGPTETGPTETGPTETGPTETGPTVAEPAETAPTGTETTAEPEPAPPTETTPPDETEPSEPETEPAP